MQILVPWKPVVLVWGLLSGMILVTITSRTPHEYRGAEANLAGTEGSVGED